MSSDPQLIRTRQLLEPGDLIELYEIDLTLFGQGILRYSPNTNGNDVVSFGGRNYLPLVVESSGFQWSVDGSLPRPTIRISNVQFIPSMLAITFQDLIGATVTRIRTFAQFLDDGACPDPDAKFPDDIYQVNRKARQSKDFVEWELATIIDQQGRKLPGRQALRDTCTHLYRRYDPTTGDFDYSRATCPYVGANYFDRGGDVTAIQNDDCGKLLSHCRLRFGENGILPTRAMPGIGRLRG